MEKKGWLSPRVLLGAILAAGALLRLFHFLAIADSALPEFPKETWDDSNIYWEWPRRILAGDLLGRETYQVFSPRVQAAAPRETWERWWGGRDGQPTKVFRTAPLYPYAVAGLYAISGESIAFVFFVQIALGALQPLVLFALARRAYGVRAGLFAAGLAAFHGPLVFYEGMLLRDFLSTLLPPLCVFALLRAGDDPRFRRFFLAGAVLAISILARETSLLFAPLALGWALFGGGPAAGEGPPTAVPGKAGPRPVPPAPWIRASASRVFAALLGLLAGLSPLIARNLIVGARPLALSNRAAQTFIQGNAPHADPAGRGPLQREFVEIMTQADGRLLPAIAATLRAYHGDLGAFFAKQIRKVHALLDPKEKRGEGLSIYFLAERSSALKFTLGHSALFPIGAAGTLLALLRLRRHSLLHLYLLSVLGGLFFGMVHDRYRLALTPILMIHGGGALAAAFGAGGGAAGRGGKYALFLLIAALAALQQAAGPVHPPEEYVDDYAYFPFGEIYAAQGRFDRAAEELAGVGERARRFPEHPLFQRHAKRAAKEIGWNRLREARALLAAGGIVEARRAAAAAEASWKTIQGKQLGDHALGLLFRDLGQPVKAKAHLERFLLFQEGGGEAEEAKAALEELTGER